MQFVCTGCRDKLDDQYLDRGVFDSSMRKICRYCRTMEITWDPIKAQSNTHGEETP